MGENADQVLPGLRLLLVEVRPDVLERNQGVVAVPGAEHRSVQGELGLPEAHQVAAPGAEVLQGRGKAGTDAVETGDFAQPGHPQKALGGVVDQRHPAVSVEHEQADADVLHHGLQVARLFLLLGPRQAKGVEDLVERRPELVEGGAGTAGGEGLREVGVADGGEEAGQFPVGAVDETDQAVDLGRRRPAATVAAG